MRNCPLVERDVETRSASSRSRWVFELDGHGTVLHSRAFSGIPVDPAILEDLGFNFFEDVEGIDDMPELRQRFRSFVNSRKATESFYIGSCGPVPTKVLLTRAFQTGMSPSPLVMMEIRNELITEHLGGYNGNTTFKLRRA
jgi:hypothetical protein